MTDELGTALRGMREATGRLGGFIQERDRDRIPIGIAEALMWACSADEELERLHKGGYRNRRSADGGGRAVRGFRWARNQQVHALIGVHVTGGGFSFPLSFPMAFTFEVFWISPDALPPPGKAQPDNEAAYRLLVGRHVEVTLNEAYEFLEREAYDQP